ncbi:venom protease [Solenopsis invicta]|uniref:venom protease n=1 Tax=Solenopsis invicta TaxID=13686 RepID=UPI0001FEDA36|nr:venom protease [Solenopsis invicta]XP_025988660.1 venom protease [Solenopsis invicta]XP_025988662.1 venom protease [Solenopsis invicta]
MWTVILVFIGLLCALIPSTHSQGACQNPQGQLGICVNIRECPLLFNLLKENSGDPQVGNFLRASVCGYQGRDPMVCCPSSNNGGNTGGTDNGLEGDRGRKEIANTPYGPLYPPDCGLSNATHFRRIVNGEPALLGTWPWVTALGYRNSKNPNVPKWLCGGVLISSRHVLTAAHCVYGREDLYKVRVGDLDLNNDYDGATPFEDFIERKTVHPQYNSKTFTNDIAVLKMSSEVRFTSLVRPICLPVDDYTRSKNLENTYPMIAGWGSVYFHGPSSSRLMQIQIPVRTQEECKYAYRNFPTTVIDDRVLCAGYTQGGKDACQGDSGGPLMNAINPQNQKTFYVIGVVSYGYKCAEPGFPGVYSKVSSFLDFITSQLV